MESGSSTRLQWMCARALPPNRSHGLLVSPPTYSAPSLSCGGRRYKKNTLSCFPPIHVFSVQRYGTDLCWSWMRSNAHSPCRHTSVFACICQRGAATEIKTATLQFVTCFFLGSFPVCPHVTFCPLVSLPCLSVCLSVCVPARPSLYITATSHWMKGYWSTFPPGSSIRTTPSFWNRLHLKSRASCHFVSHTGNHRLNDHFVIHPREYGLFSFFFSLLIAI